MGLPAFPPKASKPWARRFTYVPVTPAGSFLMHLRSDTRAEAIRKLLKDAQHMPYKTWENFQKRGYSIHKLELF
jgi:hypothetical protein